MVPMIIIDSNVWIFAEDASTDEHQLAAAKVRRVLISQGFGITPIIASEVYHRLSRVAGPSEARRRLAGILDHPQSSWLPIHAASMKSAARLAETAGIRINDALISQQALAVGAPVLTDDIKDFRKVKGLKVIPLR